MSAETDPRGLKRICTACSARFYDMNKRPIICPSCGEEFTGEVKIKTRKAKSSIIKDDAAKAIKAKSMEDDLDSEIDSEVDDDDIVSLDDDAQVDADSGDDDDDDMVAPDLDLDNGIGDDDFDDDDSDDEEEASDSDDNDEDEDKA